MIQSSTHGAVRILRLAHGKASALDLELVLALTREIEQAVGDDVRALVLTGSGHIFCAGVDLFRIADGGEDYVRRYLPALRDLFVTLFAAELPVVAAANGHAIAGGAVLVAAADCRLMSAGDARFGYTELLVGVPFPPAALEIVRFATPQGVEEMLYTGATYRADAALARRLVDELVEPEQLMIRARGLAESLARVPAVAFATTKRQLRAPFLDRMREGEARHGAAVLDGWSSAATRQAIASYLDRTVRRR